MISNYDTIVDDFKKKIKLAQETCLHEKTQWVEEYWALGHSTGCMLKVCLNCNKTLERKEPKYGVSVK